MFADAPASSPGTQELWFSLLAWGCMLPVVGAFCVGFWWMKKPRQQVWPPQRQRLVTWTMLEFALAMLSGFILSLLMASMLAPWFRLRAYDQVLVANVAVQCGNSLMANPWTPGDWLLNSRLNYILLQAQSAKLSMYAGSLAAPFHVLLMISVLVWLSRSKPLQMGLSLHRLPADVVAGFTGWLFITPLCYLVFWLVKLPALEEVIGPVAPHPLQYLIGYGPTLWEWVMLTFLVVIAAPVTEEMVYRGILQPLMVKHPLLADATIMTGLIMAIGLGLYHGQTGTSATLPFLFLGAVGMGYLAFEWLMQPWLPRPGAARAIFTSALVFAAVHFPVWPSPLPLFCLGLGLGYVTYRTQSIWGSMLMHGLFNLTTLVALALSNYLS